MTNGVIIDGEFVESDEYQSASKCDSCGDVKTGNEDEEGLSLPPTEYVDADTFGLEDYFGSVDLCGDCIVNGIGKETLERMKEEVFEEDDGGFEDV